MKCITSGIFLGVFVAFVFVGYVAAAPVDCNFYNNTKAIPDGFGAAYNTVSSARELVLDIACDRAEREARVEITANGQYVYVFNTAHTATPGSAAWTPVTLNGTSVLDPETNEPTNWLDKTGEATISHTTGEIDEDLYLISYVCVWDGNNWECGCNGNSSCSPGQWRLQRYNFPPESGSTSGSTSNGSTGNGSTSNGSTSGSTSGGVQPQTHTFNVSATNFEFDIKTITVNEGDTIVINLTNNSNALHDWVLDEFNAETDELSEGQSDSITFVADQAGTFEYYCSVPGHRQLGMIGTLTVNAI